MARPPLPAGRAGGVRRPQELRAAVAEGDQAAGDVRRQSGAPEGRRAAEAGAHPLDPQPLQAALCRGRRRRRRRQRRRGAGPACAARGAGRRPGAVARAGVPFRGRRVSEAVPASMGACRDVPAPPGRRQEPGGGAEHPRGVRGGDPVGGAVRVRGEPVLHRRLLRLAVVPEQRRLQPGAHGDRAQGRQQDPRRRAVRGVRGHANVAGGQPELRSGTGDPLLAEPDHGDDVQGRRRGGDGGGEKWPPDGLPQLLLPRQPGAGGGGRRRRRPR